MHTYVDVVVCYYVTHMRRALTGARVRARMHAHTYAHARAHMHTHVQSQSALAHTHTHTQSLALAQHAVAQVCVQVAEMKLVIIEINFGWVRFPLPSRIHAAPFSAA